LFSNAQCGSRGLTGLYDPPVLVSDVRKGRNLMKFLRLKTQFPEQNFKEFTAFKNTSRRNVTPAPSQARTRRMGERVLNRF
jgi:hypothetical protein